MTLANTRCGFTCVLAGNMGVSEAVETSHCYLIVGFFSFLLCSASALCFPAYGFIVL